MVKLIYREAVKHSVILQFSWQRARYIEKLWGLQADTFCTSPGTCKLTSTYFMLRLITCTFSYTFSIAYPELQIKWNLEYNSKIICLISQHICNNNNNNNNVTAHKDSVNETESQPFFSEIRKIMILSLWPHLIWSSV